MTRRIAAIAALIVFVVCLLTGTFDAQNTFTTAVERAVLAMMGTLVIGLIVGAMAQKMVDESVQASLSPASAETPVTKDAAAKETAAKPAAKTTGTKPTASAKPPAGKK